jgi:hypothetical protein
MRKLSILYLLFFSINCANTLNAQTCNLKNVAGYWASNSTTVRLFFFFDESNELQLISWDSTSNEEMEISRFEIAADTVKTKEKFRSTDYVTLNSYYLIDSSTMVDVISGDGEETIYFKRLDISPNDLILYKHFLPTKIPCGKYRGNIDL